MARDLTQFQYQDYSIIVQQIEDDRAHRIMCSLADRFVTLFHAYEKLRADKIEILSLMKGGDKMSEQKAFEFKIEGGYLIITADPNKDGQNVLELKIDLAEIPDEILSALGKD